MGVCFSTKKTLDIYDKSTLDSGPMKKPLKMLKQQLLEKLNLDEDHYYSIFCNYRYLQSYRQSLQNWEAMEQDQEDEEEAKKKEEQKIGLLSNNNETVIIKKNKEIFQEDNMLMATWIDDMETAQKEFDEKIVFFNNETLLNGQNVNDHFSREHKKAILDKSVEFMCKKGRVTQQNQDNLFIVLDGDIKIFGVFDGHGIHGHLVSGFASGIMLKYIRDNGKFFCRKNLEKILEQEKESLIKSKIKQCFKHVQHKLKFQYKEFLKEKQMKKNDAMNKSEKHDQNENESDQDIMLDNEDTFTNFVNKNQDELFNQQSDGDEEEEEFCETSSWETQSNNSQQQDKEIPQSPQGAYEEEDSLQREENEFAMYMRYLDEQKEKEEDLKRRQLETGISQTSTQKSGGERKIIKANQGGLNDEQIRMLQEKGLLNRLKNRSNQEKMFDIALSGTSATLVIQLPTKLIVAWVGDSLVAMRKRDKGTKDAILTLPFHTPEESEEKIRIYNNRGETRLSPLDKKPKIYVRARMYPGLQISRSLGDLLAHQVGVKSEPNIEIQDIQQTDKFFTIATDGIWNNLGPEEVSEIISEFGLKDPGTSTELISQKVKDICNSDNQKLEDITMIISYLGNQHL